MAALNAAAPRITDHLCEACAAHFEAVKAHLDGGRRAVAGRARPRARPRLLHADRVRVLRRGPRGTAAGARRRRPLRRPGRAARRQAHARASGSGSASTASRSCSRSRGAPSTPSRARSRWSSGADPDDTVSRLRIATDLRAARLARPRGSRPAQARAPARGGRQGRRALRGDHRRRARGGAGPGPRPPRGDPARSPSTTWPASSHAPRPPTSTAEDGGDGVEPDAMVAQIAMEYAADMVDLARTDAAVELDFSVDSVREVETIAGRLATAKPRFGLRPRDAGEKREELARTSGSTSRRPCACRGAAITAGCPTARDRACTGCGCRTTRCACPWLAPVTGSRTATRPTSSPTSAGLREGPDIR